MNYTLEICAGSIKSAIAAREGGADRVELCANLSEGGTTPSFGMIKVCRSLLDIPIFVMIRPRGGNFVYSDNEFAVMKQDILSCLELGCDGVVFGILLPDGSVDIERCAEIIRMAGNMQLTFHRAFDRCRDREKGLEDIIRLGFKHVLTSAGGEYADECLPELKRLVTQAGDRITVMAGSGITSKNLLTIAGETGVIEFHSTAKSKVETFAIETVQLPGFGDYPYETDVAEVRRMRQVLDAMCKSQ